MASPPPTAQLTAVGAEGDAPNVLREANRLASATGPQARDPVGVERRDEARVAVEGNPQERRSLARGLEHGRRLPAPRRPDTGSPVAARGNERVAVRAERDRIGCPVADGKDGDELAGAHVPDAHGSVLACAREPRAVRAESDAADPAAVSLERVEKPAVGHAPDADVAVEAAGGQEVAFRVEGQRRDETGAAAEDGGPFGCTSAPDLHLVVAVGRRDERSVGAGDYRKLQRCAAALGARAEEGEEARAERLPQLCTPCLLPHVATRSPLGEKPAEGRSLNAGVGPRDGVSDPPPASKGGWATARG